MSIRVADWMSDWAAWPAAVQVLLTVAVLMVGVGVWAWLVDRRRGRRRNRRDRRDRWDRRR